MIEVNKAFNTSSRRRRWGFSWIEPFTYAAGSLTGQGNWIAGSGGTDPWSTLAPNASAPARAVNSVAENEQDAALALWNPNTNFTLDLALIFKTDAIAVYNFTAIWGTQGLLGGAAMFRFDATSNAANVATFNVYTPAGGAGSFGPIAFAYDVAHTIRYQCISKVARVYVDGTLQLTSGAFPQVVASPTGFRMNTSLAVAQPADHVRVTSINLQGYRR